MLCVVYIWFRQNLWTYGPFHLFESLRTPFSDTSHQAWLSYNSETRRSLTEWRHADLRIVRSRNPNVWSITTIFLWMDDDQTTREGIKQRRWRKSSISARPNTWFGRVCDDAKLAAGIPRCQRMIAALFIAGVLIADCERTVRMNLTASGNKWGYGQIFAPVATLPAVMEVTKLLLRLGRKPK